MRQDKAEKQKKKAKEMLGISDDRAKEIFQDQPDRKQQKKKELEEKDSSSKETEDEEAVQEESGSEEVEMHACPECGDEFESSRGMKVHKGQKH